MNKMIRAMFVLFFLAGFVVIGMNGTALADKLKAGNPSPVESGSYVGLARPDGTVGTSPTCVKINKPGHYLVGSVANLSIANAPDVSMAACVAKAKDLPKTPPVHIASLSISSIELTADSGSTFNFAQQVCFPVVPGADGSAYYWDGTSWVKTEDVKDGQACVTVPTTSPSPTYVGLWGDQ